MQPTREEKIAVLRGESDAWTFAFRAPPVPTQRWNDDAWIAWIGNNWMPTCPQQEDVCKLS